MEDIGRDEEEEGQRRPRPKVVDRRISARGDEAPAEQAVPRAAPPPRAEPAPSPPPEPPSQQQPPSAPPGEPGVWTPEQEAEAQRMLDEMGRVPGRDWVIQMAVTLANVAGVKLDGDQAADANVAIDALAGILNAAGARLGEAEAPLRQTLAQLQLAYASKSGPAQP